ncbi:Protein of unknown function [Pyronema omphalodes CBS 100304]|uniref:Uncharacterized protein n=1 Tax=Pyronema omphalodes (strain CBS 100304) TaxID=1076935 RepID=U4LK45_PYROM|nr:Protein of unknown function [Pyronema omphalodes CBS 100304]
MAEGLNFDQDRCHPTDSRPKMQETRMRSRLLPLDAGRMVRISRSLASRPAIGVCWLPV